MAGNGYQNFNVVPSVVARVKAAATTNITVVKAVPVTVTGYAISNSTATQKFFKFYDKATAPVLASDTPAWTLVLEPNTRATFDVPLEFANGLAYAITNLVADTDATAVTADAVHGFIAYK